MHKIIYRRGIFSLVVVVLFVIVGILFLSPLRPGNSVGVDDWTHVYRASHGGTEINGHPLSSLGVWLTLPLFGPNFIAYHAFWIGLWIFNAFLVYLLVTELCPEQPLFAVTAGLIAVVYYQDSFFSTQMFLAMPDVYLSPTFVLLAFIAQFAALYRDGLNPAVRVLVYIFSLLCLVGAVLMRQQPMLLLGFVPLFVHYLKRGRWVSLVPWNLVWGGCAAFYALPLLGIGGATYGSELYVGFSLQQIVSSSWVHFSFALQPLLHPGRQRILAELPLIAALFVVVALAFWLFRPLVSEPAKQGMREHLVWIGGSALAAWLSFAPYLVSVAGASTLHQHYLSRYSEAILLARLSLAIGEAISQQWLIQLLGTLYITMAGTAMVGYVQDQMDYYGATWGTAARFMRSLAEFAPDLKDRTLIIYIENPDMFETPFTAGVSFQYAMRYFYGDRATGIIPTDNVFGSGEIDDSGVAVEEQWVGRNEYGWNEIIFIGRHEDGTIYVMDEIPEPYYEPDRQALYAPGARVVQGPVNERIRLAYPSYATDLP
jgi:hypothetical protein